MKTRNNFNHYALVNDIRLNLMSRRGIKRVAEAKEKEKELIHLGRNPTLMQNATNHMYSNRSPPGLVAMNQDNLRQCILHS